MAAGLSLAINAALLLPRTGVTGGKKVLSSPTIWEALTRGSADAVAMGDSEQTIDDQFRVIVDVNEARIQSTAAVAGGVFLASQMWFFNKLRMAERMLAAGEIFQAIRSQTQRLELMTAANATDEAKAAAQSIDDLGRMLNYVTDAEATADVLTDIRLGTLNLSATLQTLTQTEPLLLQNKQLMKVASSLFDPSDVLGIRPLTKQLQIASRAPRAALAVAPVASKFSTLFAASEAAAKISGTSTGLARVGTAAKIAGGKILLVDTVIWAVTMGIDLGLNLFMSEEQQANLPIIGFLFEGSGWSPIGEALEWVIVSVGEAILGEENVQTLKEIFTTAILAAAQAPLIEDALEIILQFYVNEIDVEMLAPLNFDGFDFNLEEFPFNPLRLIRADPIVILEWAVYLIVIKLVVNQWLRPMVRYLLSDAGPSS